MKEIKIFGDSCSDLTDEIRKKHDVVSIDQTIFFKGKEISADPWKDVTPQELYGALREGNRIYTLPATEYEIRRKFTKYMNDYDIVYVAACEKLSTTIVKARRIAEELMQENEGVRIEIVDSLNASIGQLFVTLRACQLRDEGKTVDEIIEGIKPIRKKILQFATVDNLTYLSKAEKINARSAMLGNLLNIKPILISDVDGRQVSMESVKGREKSLHTIVDRFIENAEFSPENSIYIIHGDDLDTALKVKEMLTDRGCICKEIKAVNVGPVIGISTGPGMVGIFGYGKEVTFKGA